MPVRAPRRPAPANATLVALLRDLWRVAGPRTLWAVALTVLAGLTEGFGLVLLLPLLGLMGVEVTAGAAGPLTDAVASGFARLGLQPTLTPLLACFLALLVARALLQRWQSLVALSLQFDYVAHLRARLYRALAHAGWPFFARRHASDFTHALTVEADRVGSGAQELFRLAASGVVTAMYLGLALLLSWSMTLLVLACGLLLVLLLRGKTRASYQTGLTLSEVTGQVQAVAQEHLNGMKTVKSYGAEARSAALFAQLGWRIAAVQVDAIRHWLDARGLFDVGSGLALCAILYVALELLAIPPGSLLLLLFLYMRLVPSFALLQESVQHIANNLAAYATIGCLEMECAAAAEAPLSPAPGVPPTLREALRFERVSLAYEAGAPPVLADVDLTVPAGGIAAIVGPSGAGKSTLADLALGLLTPTTGSISVDGVALTPEWLAAWRGRVGYVPQETFLFHDTVRANLLWAEPEAGEADIWRALELAALDHVIEALPQGLDTVLGDRGIRLSGGERQRLALARALLRRPALLVLDEATSALDSANEQQIWAALERLRGEMTLLVISHRLGPVRRADVIYVLQGGRLVEAGSWSELLARPAGYFRALCAVQGVIDIASPDRPPVGGPAGASHAVQRRAPDAGEPAASAPWRPQLLEVID